MQAWDRFLYARSNPIKYNDPTGHFANPANYIDEGGRIPDPRSQANDLAFNLKHGDSSRTWFGLSKEEKSVLQEGGWGQGSYNDFMDDDTRQATLLEDPAFYFSVAVGGGAKFVPGLVSGACADGNCANEIETAQNGITVLGRYLHISK